MKLVVDSNCLRAAELERFLRSSSANRAVLPDYAAMEALKGDPLVGMCESMKILARFPAQVLILKTTLHVCGLSGQGRGLQRRLVDSPATREFGLFCERLTEARAGSLPLASQLEVLGHDARSHLDRVMADSRGFAESSVEAAAQFSALERRAILLPQAINRELQMKLNAHLMYLAGVMFELHPSVRRPPRSDVVLNTYIFRSAVCHLLLGFAYANVGGVQAKAPAKIRNDLVDAHFATYATFFDGLLTKDAFAKRLYDQTINVLTHIARSWR